MKHYSILVHLLLWAVSTSLSAQNLFPTPANYQRNKGEFIITKATKTYGNQTYADKIASQTSSNLTQSNENAVANVIAFFIEPQLKLAEDRVFRQDALLKRDAVSKEAYEQVKTDLATLNADIEIVKANIELTELRAPFDGIIGLRQVSVGTYASPTTVVAKLTKIAPLKVEFSVPERYAKQIKKGTNLNFSVEGKLDAFGAQVYAVESAIDPNLHQFTARALYPNVNHILLPGRYTSVLLKKEEIPDAIAIPTEAIVPEMGKDKVYLYKSGKAEPVDIITGIRTASEVQVIRGLHMGDTIITSGTLQLRTGLVVKLDNID